MDLVLNKGGKNYKLYVIVMGIMGASFCWNVYFFQFVFDQNISIFNKLEKIKNSVKNIFILNNTSYKDILANEMFQNSFIKCHPMNQTLIP